MSRISTGAKPVGKPEATPQEAAADVQSMFDGIARRYDLMNHLLSGGVDGTWWWRAARAVRDVLKRPDAVVVDLCCGTGDMSLAMQRRRPSTFSTAPILAVDFSHQMLGFGADKFIRKNILAVEGDAMVLPVASGRTDLISCAFGFRNLAVYEDGLREMFRALKSGGQIAILECNRPAGAMGVFYYLYFGKLLPLIGGIFSDVKAYTYLPDSVERFPRPPQMLELIHSVGFKDATWTSYTFGVAGLYLATKP